MVRDIRVFDFKPDWDRPVHTGVSDDLDLLIAALEPHRKGRFITISAHGAGEAAFTLAAAGADRVLAYDIESADHLQQLVSLKLTAARHFSREDYLVIMGLRPASRLRKRALVKRLVSALDPHARSYWQKKKKQLEAGLFFADQLTLFFNLFKVSLRALAPESARNQILGAASREVRLRAFRRYVRRPWLRRVLEQVGRRINLFFPQSEWDASEYPKELNRDPLYFLERLVEAGLAENPLFAHQVLDRAVAVPESLLPPHLRPKHFDGLRNASSRVRVVQTRPKEPLPITDAAGPLSGAYLSNIIDYLRESERVLLFRNLRARLALDAPVLVYSNEAFDKVPESCGVELDEEKSAALANSDRARIYRRVLLYRATGDVEHEEEDASRKRSIRLRVVD